ncbi:MAG: serine hydrolase domain-containing protein [Pseudomonadota bacterium]
MSQFETNIRRVLLGVGIAMAIAGLSSPASATPSQERLAKTIAETAGPHLQHQLQHVLDHAVSHTKPHPGAALLAISRLHADDDADHVAAALVVGTHSQSDNAPVFLNTPFGVASITKMMVAALTFVYAERGLLDLDTPISDLVGGNRWLLTHASHPEFRGNLQSSTLRDLLAHRSGLPDYWQSDGFLSLWHRAKDKNWSPTELIDWASRQPPACAPRSCFKYSDTNYVIVGLVLEQLAGRQLHEQLRAEIFKPLRMNCSWMFFQEPVPRGCAEPTHSYEGDLDVTDNRMQSADWSGGGVYSTLDDQLRLLRGLFNGKLVSSESLVEMQKWIETDLGNDIEYGLGLYKTKAGPGMTLVGHTGIHNAFSFLWLEEGVLISGSLNQSENHALSRLVFPVVRILQGGGYANPSH